MTAVVVGCCVGAAPEELPQACLCATCAMGVAGEVASENMAAIGGGTGTYRNMLLDAMSTLDGPAITCRAKVKYILQPGHTEFKSPLLFWLRNRCGMEQKRALLWLALRAVKTVRLPA